VDSESSFTALRVHYEARGCRALAAMVRDWRLPELTRRRAMLREPSRLYRRHRYAAAVKVLTGFEEAVVMRRLMSKGVYPARQQEPQILFAQHVGRGRSGAASSSPRHALFASFGSGSSWTGREPSATASRTQRIAESRRVSPADVLDP